MSNKEELSPQPEAITAAPARTSKAFRDGLLGRLPLLHEPGWQAKEAFDVHEDLAELGRSLAPIPCSTRSPPWSARAMSDDIPREPGAGPDEAERGARPGLARESGGLARRRLDAALADQLMARADWASPSPANWTRGRAWPCRPWRI